MKKERWGFFDMTSDEKDQKTWEKEFNDMINSLSDDTLISIYDCHI